MIAPLAELALEAARSGDDKCLRWVESISVMVASGMHMDRWLVAVKVHDWHVELHRAQR